MRKLLSLCLVMLTGCYSYVPVSAPPLDRGTTVRARLSDPTDFRLTDISVNNTSVVDGEVVQHGADTLVVSALSLHAATGYSVPAAGETLRIPTGSVARLERRRLDLLRSGLLSAATVLVVGLLFSVFDAGGEGGQPGGGGPNPQ